MHYLLRHGETNFNKLDLIQGHSPDSHLTKKGELEMEWAAQELQKRVAHFDEVICSDLERTQEAWKIIGRIIRWSRFSLSQALREQCQGRLEGMHYSNLEKKTPTLIEGVEIMENFSERVKTFFERLNPVETILVISHGGVLECRLRQLGVKNPRVANGEIICIDGESCDGKPTIYRITPAQ